MNSSEDLSDKVIDTKKKVKFLAKKKKDVDVSSSAASGDDDDENDEYIESPASSYNRNSLTVPVNNTNSTSNSGGTNVFRKYRKRLVWEVMEGYRDPNLKVTKPDNFEGILLKRRNWPMKGWHKRFFMLADGILSYGKSKSDITKNKVHGTVNTYLSIVSYITVSRRILIDFSQSNAFVCHLKAKTQSDFDAWIDHLKKHRLYYQYKYTQTPPSVNRHNSISIQPKSNNNSSITISNFSNLKKLAADEAPQDNQPQVESLIKKTTVLSDNELEEEFKQIENNLINLSKVLGLVPSKNKAANEAEARPPSTHHSHQPSSCSFDYLMQNSNSNKQIHLSKSNPNLINNEIISSSNKLVANTFNSVNSNNLSVVGSLVCNLVNIDTNVIGSSDKENENSNKSSDELARLTFYQNAKSINDQLNFLYQQLLVKKQSILAVQKDSNKMENSLHRSQRSQSVMSSISMQDSQLQFYDAIEYFTSESESDDNSEESDDGSGGNNKSIIKAIVPEELQGQKMLTRRRKLPAIAPDTSQVSIWGILRKAIGKDLSKIALPFILNEPLGILQRLCEELEYSDLLEIASTKQDPFDRMVYIAAFIISGYSSSYYRNGAKDFNPLLGETYELIRPDKGWKYVAEQVSHHPPVSATHCQSKTFTHEQIFHAKIKFWGRSMEVHPEGYTKVTLPKFDETYQWNKIVMYVSNLTGSQRRIEHIGQINILCTNGVSCTITFPKAGYAAQKNEFYGDIVFENVVKRKIFGQWHEAFLCGTDNTAKTIWRMGAMPEDANLYYGFTRFAIELNEFTEDLKEELPPTDTRYRPDQRHFENGKVDEAEQEKQKIEEKQRERRREQEAKGEEHQPLWFSLDKTSKSNKDWIFNNQYWMKRESPGYKNLKHIFPNLW